MTSIEKVWMRGFVTAPAESHRLLLGGNGSAGIRKVADGANVTLAVAREAGCSAFDVKELRKAGVR